MPPFVKHTIEIDADRGFFKEKEILSASIRFLTIVQGEAVVQKTLVLRANDTDITSKIALFHDIGEEMGYQVTWYKKSGEEQEPTKILKDDYIILIPK